MSGRLKGKIAFCTAAGAGIGQATALRFLEEGAHVIATDLNEASLAALTGADCRKLDVLSTEAVDAMAKEIGGVDILFNCAGYVHHGSAVTTSDEDWDFSFNLNVKSMHRTIRAFLPGMIARGGGSIVNISSIASSVRGLPNRYVYGASKAAVIGLTKSVAADFIGKNIRCNAIGPGTVQSPSLNERIKALAATNGITEAAAREMFVARQPMGRLGTAREIADIALYLASDEAAFTTGQMYMVDGGMTI
ncbi:MAG: SDR family oxidoreductase [Rhodoblastus sp.]|nr:SDR family oxidoreductase [Rhodoblastus sp.]MCC2108989.1 SDR family oxidoreductase [Hyphomicrobiales bacterium]